MLPIIANLARYAIFLDFDGTLVAIADRPNDVRVGGSVSRRIESLSRKTEQALAVVSGREIAAIDQLLLPLKLPIAGVHGLERRDSAGRLHTSAINGSAFAAIASAIRGAIGAEPGIFIEIKPGAVALHFRLRPELESRCCDIVDGLMRERIDLVMLRGKMVFEIRQSGPNKGTAIEAFLGEPPFAGRIPIFAGDDVTDEEGFAVVNAHSGISIKIGPEPTIARHRAANAHEFQDWLDHLAFASCKEASL